MGQFSVGVNTTSLLGRNDATEVVLVRELDAALARLNPKLAAMPTGRTKQSFRRMLGRPRHAVYGGMGVEQLQHSSNPPSTISPHAQVQRRWRTC
jgi:hypothetical protein